MREMNFDDWASTSKIDPVLLELLLEKSNKKENVEEKPQKQQSFAGLTAVYIGVSVMVLIVVLGILHVQETNEILWNACFGLLIFCGVGFVFGKIMEMLLQESSKNMIREMIQKTESISNTGETAQDGENHSV